MDASTKSVCPYCGEGVVKVTMQVVKENPNIGAALDILGELTGLEPEEILASPTFMDPLSNEPHSCETEGW